MGLSVTFVSGPRRSGKSAVIQTMIGRLWTQPPHYIRLVKSGGDKHPPQRSAKPPSNCGVASARWLEYAAEQAYEVLPDALTAIHRQDRFGSVVVEADADPVLRHAYPYDHRVLVMPLPSTIRRVFRDPGLAAAEFQRVLDDTHAFAKEFFGLDAGDASEDSEPPEARPELSAAQMRSFLYSPLGDELASRIQLQQAYHGLVESDVIIVNTGVGTHTVETGECLRRIQQLLKHVRGQSGRPCQMFRCNPCDCRSPTSRRLLRALKPMCVGGK